VISGRIILIGVGVLTLFTAACVGLNSSETSRNPSSYKASSARWEKPYGLWGADHADFEHLSEGSDFYPYDWMMALRSLGFEDAKGKKSLPFFQDLDTRFGLLPSKNLRNADGKTYLMPYVGLTAGWSNHPPDKTDAFTEDQVESVRTINGVKSIKMVGTNCALCHSGAVNFRGQQYRIDGGPAMVNVRGYFQDMAKSTLVVLAKKDVAEDFLRRLNVPNPKEKAAELNHFFYKRLGETTYGIFNAGPLSAKITIIKAKFLGDTRRVYKGRQAIGESLEKLLRMTYGFSDTEDIGELSLRMKFLGNLMVGTDPKTEETASGYGRTDAFGRIGNLVLRGDDPISYTAPVSLPWIWGIKYMAMLHYSGNSNSSILRNVGQSLGLGSLILNPQGDSTVNIHNLVRLEGLVHKIPVPELQKVFAGVAEMEVNQQLAARGEPVYAKNCMGCHESNTFVGPTKKLRDYKMISLDHLGTDPYAARNAVQAVGTLEFEKSIFQGVGAIRNRYYEKYNISPEQQAKMEYRDRRGNEFFRDTLNGFNRQDEFKNDYGNIEPGKGYKARHLSGVWATAPYLHNGSVPSIWALLQDPKDRPKIFEVQSTEIDPATLGFASLRKENFLGMVKRCKKKENQCFDIRHKGNSNAGHVYGTTLSNDEKVALIEYLKVLPPEPEYSW